MIDVLLVLLIIFMVIT
ncbi:MAG: hypothetical protein M3Z32_06500, partial [Acidobacteriota bacterium]|nr:hypothetical protein [Acidobacteriota bacterium]